MSSGDIMSQLNVDIGNVEMNVTKWELGAGMKNGDRNEGNRSKWKRKQPF